jgi:hypothetical protein
LAILGLAESRQFDKSPDFEKTRKRTYTTKELAKALVKHYPDYANLPKGFADATRPEGVEDLIPNFKTTEELSAMMEPYGREEHLFFHKQIKKWAPILQEVARIEITWQKHTDFPGFPERRDPDRPARTFWMIQAPRYKNRNLFGNMVWITWSLFPKHDKEKTTIPAPQRR